MSRNNKSNLADNIMDATPEEVTRVMKEAEVKILIHGHTHRPAIHHLTINHRDAERIVLGAWHHQGSYLQVSDDGKRELMTC